MKPVPIKQIDVRAIFEAASGHPLPKPKPYVATGLSLPTSPVPPKTS